MVFSFLLVLSLFTKPFVLVRTPRPWKTRMVTYTVFSYVLVVVFHKWKTSTVLVLVGTGVGEDVDLWVD